MVNNQDQKGKGWHGNSAGHAKAGRQGGKVTAERHGESFYSQIGRIGGQKSRGNFKNDPKRAQMAGRNGGRIRSRK